MGRPRKDEIGPIPTKERILNEAMKLFSEFSYEAVSIRKITKSLGLNEASLYNHYKSKEELLEAIFEKIDKDLIQPGFKVPPPGYFESLQDFSLSEFLIEGAKVFFNRTDEQTLYTWRTLISHQYRFESAKDSVKTYLLNAPYRFFSDLLSSIQEAGRIGLGVDCNAAGRILASIFFDYSFRENLNINWDDPGEDFEILCREIQFFTRYIAEIK